MPLVTRWKLYDAVDDLEFTFTLNPREGGTPQSRKTVNYQNTAAPGGNTLIYEGRDEVQTLEWSGIILEESHLNQLQSWFEIRRQLLLTDDLGREFWIYITSFTPQRIRTINRPWRHDYTMSAIILDYA